MGRYNERDAEEAMYGNPYYAANVRNNSSMMMDNTMMSQDQSVRRSMNIIPELPIGSHKRVRSSTNNGL